MTKKELDYPKQIEPCKNDGYEYIRRNDAITSICKWGTALERSGRYTITINAMKQECADMLCELPFVKQRTGRWVKRYKANPYPFWEIYKCSLCGRSGEDTFEFCPHCGAKMESEEDKE